MSLVAGIDTPALRDAYVLCRKELRRGHAPTAFAADLLPLQARPHLHAIGAFAAMTDRIADEDTTIAQWRAATLDDLRRGISEHPIRAAFLHTVRLWDLDRQLVEEMLAAWERDSRGPWRFPRFADLRGYLRGVSGTVAELATPLLEPSGRAQPLMSLLGEAFQLVDIFQDFPTDLARGRCYLPMDELAAHGLTEHDLGSKRSELDAVIDTQVARARDLVSHAERVVSLVHVSSRPFLETAILGVRALLDEAGRRKSAVLRKGIRQPRRLPRRLPAVKPLVPSLPNHIAVIMDGNRRWAAARGESPAVGHLAGEGAVVRLVECAVELGLPHLSVFAFSSENWTRPQDEVSALISHLAAGIERHRERFHALGVRVRWCGRRDRVQRALREVIEAAERLTARNTGLSLTVCGDYGGREEILRAAGSFTGGDEAVFAGELYVPDLPDVDLLIRTSGEQRISNFLPWHIGYAELVFDPVLWPDFDRVHLMAAINEYARRDRRFGAESEVVTV